MMERKNYQATLKSFDNENLIVECLISTETEDRVGDIVMSDGMKIRGRPVVLFGHGRGSQGQEPIAKPLSITKTVHGGVKGIAARVQFFPDELGRRLFEKVREGYISGWSIGFIIIRSEDINGGRGRKIIEWELLEFSLVAIPAQPEAQTLAFKILPDGAEEGCGGSCKGAVKCAGHQGPTIRFLLGPSGPRRATRKEIVEVATGVIAKEIQRQARQMMGKVD